MYFENFNLTDIVTPVKAEVLETLLQQSNYPEDKTQFLGRGFKEGFDPGYSGPTDIHLESKNLKLRVGNETVLWNKITKEVKCKRYAEPFTKIPYNNFIQSPVGLVPKGDNDTRLIFHLSHPRDGGSVNGCMPKELCTVRYCDFTQAIQACMELGITCKLGKSDMKGAFRNLCMKPSQFYLLVLKARSPLDGRMYYFIDKCLPFGASISCAHFQKFSDTEAHIMRYKLGLPRDHKIPVNYLDDFLFAAITKAICDGQLEVFLKVCKEINFPVAIDKTVSSTTRIIFLGLLIDTIAQIISIPVYKVARARELVELILNNRKTTVRNLQKVCRHLNFLCRCIIPGRAFTRRIYSYFSSNVKSHHHVKINSEMKKDLQTWLTFLNDPVIYCRPFIDFSAVLSAEDLDWTTDASGKISFGGIHKDKWFWGDWSSEFLKKAEPSIEFQELYAVAISITLWAQDYKNKRIRLKCDNQSVMHMINNSASSCKYCMILIRHITLVSLRNNVRIFAKHIRTELNGPSDALSRNQISRFYELTSRQGKMVEEKPEEIPDELWPVEKLWNY